MDPIHNNCHPTMSLNNNMDMDMEPDQWVDTDCTATSPRAPTSEFQQPAHQDQLDRQMLRHLMRKYTAKGLARLMHEEESFPSQLSPTDASSVLTTSTYSSSIKSEDDPSLFDSGSIRTFSDTSSARGSIGNIPRRISKSHNSSSHTSETPYSPSQRDTHDNASIHSTETTSTTTSYSKQKGTFVCGFCKEEGVQRTCTRKNDLKRHIEDFHNTNSQWFCPQKGCNRVFDWQTVFKSHLKTAHHGLRISLDDSKVDLCPQTVFACGFNNCIQVYESPSDLDAPAIFKEYVTHVVKHLDDGTNSGEWSYSTRIRNLMRQASVLRVWQLSGWPESERNTLTWDPQTSGTLRKRLETRHLGDIELLIHHAIALGYGSDSVMVKDFADKSFFIPVKETCQMLIPGHKSKGQAEVQRQSQVPESDPFQFRISRGNVQDMNLANFYASQRHYTPRQTVRTGRSTRKPIHINKSHNMNSQQSQPQVMYDSTSFYGQPQQVFGMMPMAGSNVMGDDFRNLRTASMASATPGTEMDMAQAQAQAQLQAQMDAAFLTPDLLDTFNNGFPNTMPTDGQNFGDIKIDQNHQFNTFGPRHTF